MRKIELSRREAEWLVDLLEACDRQEVNNWRHGLAEEIRAKFGMKTFEQEYGSQPPRND